MQLQCMQRVQYLDRSLCAVTSCVTWFWLCNIYSCSGIAIVCWAVPHGSDGQLCSFGNCVLYSTYEPRRHLCSSNVVQNSIQRLQV